jgi:AraC family transcriptional regulator
MNGGYTLQVKNMVCTRCVLIVKGILSNLQIEGTVTLGKIMLAKSLDQAGNRDLADALQRVGLEIVESRASRLIEDIKQGVLAYIMLGLDAQQFKLSVFVASRIPHDFGYLSDLFSKTEGISIEKYFIHQRMEKVKELIACDQLSLTEISYETGFSSVHHLSAQFKKITGLTPSQYKASRVQQRRALDGAGA